MIPIKRKLQKFGTDPTMEDQIRIYKTKKFILHRPSGPVLDTALLSTQHYKVRIKGKVEQSRETSSALPYTSNKVTNLTNLISLLQRLVRLIPYFFQYLVSIIV